MVAVFVRWDGARKMNLDLVSVETRAGAGMGTLGAHRDGDVLTLRYAPSRLRSGFGLWAAAAYAGLLLVAIASGRYGVMWIHHAAQTCIEVDVGAVHGLWIAKTASSAFAPSSVDLIDHGGWNFSGWRPRVDCASAGMVYVAMPLWLLGLPLLAPVFVRRRAAGSDPGPSDRARSESAIGRF